VSKAAREQLASLAAVRWGQLKHTADLRLICKTVESFTSAHGQSHFRCQKCLTLLVTCGKNFYSNYELIFHIVSIKRDGSGWSTSCQLTELSISEVYQ